MKTHLIIMLAALTVWLTSCSGGQQSQVFPDKPWMTVVQPQKTDIIPWSKGQKLKWGDFKGNPDRNKKYLSASTVTIECKWYCVDGKIQYRVSALFSKSRSWVKKEGQNEYILKHEQLHFDLTEVYARMIRREIGLLTNPCENQEKTKGLIAELKEEHHQDQLRYDRETNHGENRTAQKKWEEDIKKRLHELDMTTQQK